MSNPQVILASASPRRLALLQQIGLHPLVIPADIDEQANLHEAAEDYVVRMALEKATAVSGSYENTAIDEAVVIGSDTTIDLDGEILGKPLDLENALTMLQKLSSRSHYVHTGVALIKGDDSASVVVSSKVFFRDLSNAEICDYWRSGEPQGKAGAYAIQGMGSIFVEKIIGSYSSIMGLPLFETAGMLKEFGVTVLQTEGVNE